MSRLLILLTILVAACCINGYYYPPYGSWGCKQPVYTGNGTHSVFIGCVKPTDRLLYNQTIYKPGSFFSTAQKIVRYPKPGYLRNETISGVWLYDYDRFGKGGYGRIISGGIGYKNVSIELRSYKRGRGFNFLVQIYGS